MRKIVLLGASGSIGTQTIDVCLDHQDELEVVGLSVGHNIKVLKDILKSIKPKYVCTMEYNEELIKEYPEITFFNGDEGLIQLTSVEGYDLLVNALVGVVGFKPTLNAIELKRDIALANKETLVVAGEIITKAIKDNGVNLYPIDSEHSAIYQCLIGNRHEDVKRLIVTASGGSFRDVPKSELGNVTVADALKHPCWDMGAKITIDSATLMNKGYEVIEAHYLFDIDYDHIDVLMHRESIVHSMVEYKDGSVLAQLSNPDMRLPIQFALLSPNHVIRNNYEPLDLAKLACLHFEHINEEKMHLIDVAKMVGTKAGNFGAILNAANDTAVALFLKDKIKFLDIEKAIDAALANATYLANPNLDEVIDSYNWSKEFVLKMFNQTL